MTTLTAGTKTCSRDSGLLIRDCPCDACEEIRDEYRYLWGKIADIKLSSRSEEEKELSLRANQKMIDRYDRQYL